MYVYKRENHMLLVYFKSLTAFSILTTPSLYAFLVESTTLLISLWAVLALLSMLSPVASTASFVAVVPSAIFDEIKCPASATPEATFSAPVFIASAAYKKYNYFKLNIKVNKTLKNGLCTYTFNSISECIACSIDSMLARFSSFINKFHSFRN